VQDVERLRNFLGLESLAVLGHSFGGLLAMEYAIRHPEHVSHLILMNSAPASHNDYMHFRRELLKRRAPADLARLTARATDPLYGEGDPDTVAAYYRNHFRAAIRQTEHLEQVVATLRASFTREGVLKARAIEDRLMDETYLSSDYHLVPSLQRLDVPTLVIHSEHDFVPLECDSRTAAAIPGAHLAVLRDCGHFSYLECPDQLREVILTFFNRT
jgi:proline iminopeptidase